MYAVEPGHCLGSASLISCNHLTCDSYHSCLFRLGPARHRGVMVREVHSSTLMSEAGRRQRESRLCSTFLPIMWLWSNTHLLNPVALLSRLQFLTTKLYKPE